MATDRERLVQHQIGSSGSSPNISNVDEAVKAMHRRTVRLVKLAADAIAADVTANGNCAGNGTPTFAVQASVFRKSKLVAARILPTATVTAHASNYATINVTKDDGAGGGQTVVLTNTTKPTANSGLGNLAAGSYVSLTSSLVGAAVVCDAGSYLQLQIAKANSGVVVTACTIELDFEEV